MFAERLKSSNTRIINGAYYTEFNNTLFLGKNVNSVMLNIIARAMKSRDLLELYECHVSNGKLELVHGVETKPFLSAISVNEDGVAYITEGYLSKDRQYINWNSVGAVGYQGRVIWMHPDLSVNLHLVKNKNYSDRLANNKTTKLTEDEPYKNLTEFKRWLSRGRVLRVVDWNGKRNRRGMRLEVVDVLKTKGFKFDAYFNNRKVGSDFMDFLPSSCYAFKTGGYVNILSENGDFICALEPVNN